MFWKLFYQLKGVKGLNEAIKNSNIKDAVNFLKVYLDRSFDSSAEEPFLIFDFLDDYVNETGDYELCESLMIASKYFETMPSGKVVDALDEFMFVTTWDCDTEKFSRYLISKITDSKVLLEYSFKDIANLYECYSGLEFEDKILDLGVDYIIKLSEELEYFYSKKLLAFCKERLSLEEMEKLCKNGDFAVPDIIEAMLQSYDDLEFNMLFDIIRGQKEKQCSAIDKKREKKITIFKEFLDEINKDEKITNQHKNYLAMRLLESKDYPRMLDWLANIECDVNKKLIDELVGKVPDFTLLYSIASKNDISYAVCRILEQGNMNKFGFQTGDSLFIDDYETIEKLNLVLDALYDVEPNIKFSKDLVINFLKNGVNKFPVLINEYELTDEERLEVLVALKEINSDWLIIYGNYLAIGNYMAKTPEEVAIKQMARIRELKSSSEEM